MKLWERLYVKGKQTRCWMQGLPDENKCPLFSIFGLVPFGEDLLLTFSKSGNVHFPLFGLGVWTTSQSEFEVCLWFCDLVHSQWPDSVQYHLEKYQYSSVSILLKTMKKQHNLFAEVSV